VRIPPFSFWLQSRGSSAYSKFSPRWSVRPWRRKRDIVADARADLLMRSCFAITARIANTASRNIRHESRYCSVCERHETP